MKPMDNYVYDSTTTLQKKAVSQTITNFISDEYAIERLGWKWDEILVPCVEDSTFDRIHRSGKISLAILLRHDDFRFIRARRKIPDNAVFLLDENARLYSSYRNMVSSGGRPATPFVSLREITADIAGLADFADNLPILAKVAASSGGWIITGDEVTVGQWLRFHGLQVPDNEQDTRNLLDLLNFSTLPAPPKYGNYWQLLDASDESPFKLEGNNRSIILDLIQSYTRDFEAIVNVLGRRLLIESTSGDGAITSTDYRLQQLIESAASRHGQHYLSRLGWLNEQAETKQSTELMEQLAVAVILLDLDPALDIANTHFAGFDLYSRRYFKQYPSRVRADLEAHLIKNLNVEPSLAPLVSQMVLAGMAPEYLFSDWPSSLLMGTPAWVIATQAVHLVEALAPGASRKMTYQHLMGFSQSTKALAPLAALQAEGSVDPVVTWAWMNGFITRDAQGELGAQEIERAIREYDHYIGLTLEAAEHFSRPFPDRRQLALKELKTQERDCDPDELLVKHRGSGGGAGRKVSVLDLYMGDELHTQDWDRIRGTSIYKSFPELPYLYPVAELYESATTRHFDAVLGGLARNIQIAISQVLPEDAASLEYGAIGVYCVQKMNYRPARTNGRGGISPATYLPGETGRYGVILCVKHGYAVKCFELLPLRMECRYNPDLEAFFEPLVSGNFYQLDTRFADQKQLEKVPIDLQAYLQNVPPKTGVQSRIQVRRIGVLEAPADHSDRDNQIPLYRSSRMETLGWMVARKNPYTTEQEIHQLGLQQTAREKAIEKTDAIFNMILNLIIPFKGCVEGLNSGDPKKQGGAIFDCIVDAAVLAITLFAAPVAIAAAASKAATIAGKLLSASRILASTALSLFNPLSGLPQLLKAGGKLLGRGVARLSGHALSLAHHARQQLRFLTGANSYDLLKVIDHTGSAAQARMSLDTVSHARALLKSDAIETAQHIVTRLSDTNFKLPKGATETELRHLANNAVKETAYQSKQAGDLESLIGRKALEELTEAFIKGHPVQLNNTRSTAQGYTETLAVLYELESKKARYMTGYQQDILKLDLGKPPYSDVMPEALFNPLGYTDPSQRATAWMLKGSTSNGNDFDNVLGVLRDYTANKASLTDPNVIRDIHRKLVPEAVDKVRDAGAPTKYGSSPTGFALLEQHLKHLDPSHPHFDKQVLGAVVGFQGFGDGNGRTASALYSISQLRNKQFTAMPPHVFRELNGIF
ncbi:MULTISPECIES: hypothetical protein [Pseudomonas]|uniref:Fido domain-containing protein n=1 Tax=Pseudomonas aphyarum TaxID=2942629 RepID=A0ABT5PKF3_9PSED|nr:hypothetical protein [Pseudomonas aphyarum]MDD0968337.1 hypothetical protein [Pseudomonas aphyarum]MDD1124036.1 hypothetical protein [Pseudomonas aphyarum]